MDPTQAAALSVIARLVGPLKIFATPQQDHACAKAMFKESIAISACQTRGISHRVTPMAVKNAIATVPGRSNRNAMLLLEPARAKSMLSASSAMNARMAIGILMSLTLKDAKLAIAIPTFRHQLHVMALLGSVTATLDSQAEPAMHACNPTTTSTQPSESVYRAIVTPLPVQVRLVIYCQASVPAKRLLILGVLNATSACRRSGILVSLVVWRADAIQC